MKPNTTERILNWLCNYFCTLHGITALYYSEKQKRVKYSYWLKIYALLHNIFTLCLMPFFVLHRYRKANPFNDLFMLQFLNFFFAPMFCTIALFSVLNRCQRQRRIYRIMNELYELDQSLFDRMQQDMPIVEPMKIVIYLRMVFYLYETLVNSSNIIMASYNFFEIPLIVHAEILFLVISGNMLSATMFQFSVGLRTIQHRFHVLNKRLAQILNQVNSMQPLERSCQRRMERLSQDILELSATHTRMMKLTVEFVEAYKYQLSCMLAYCVLQAILSSYFLILAFVPRIDQVAAVLAMVTLLIRLFDNLAFNSLCECTAETANETQELLRLETSIATGDTYFERCCEIFALQLSREKLRICIFGTFNINKKLTFAFYATIVSYFIVLLQGDYIWLFTADKSLETQVGPYAKKFM